MGKANTSKAKKIAAGLLAAVFMAGSAGLTAAGEDARRPVVSAPVSPDTVRHATAFHLAYVRTNSPRIDDESLNGLEALSEALRRRSAVEPEGVAGLDPEKDEFLFFPFIYWPVTAQAGTLSENARKKVQAYLGRGGMILFDVLDGEMSSPGGGQSLRRLLGDVAVRPLRPLKEEDTLGKSFYLVSGLPGSRNETVWVERAGADGLENVSSVIAGGNRWASAWAGSSVDGESREMALRAGVNLVMYALSGNYKSDQVHIKNILERLGR